MLWQKKLKIVKQTTLKMLTGRKYLLDVGHHAAITLCKINSIVCYLPGEVGNSV